MTHEFDPAFGEGCVWCAALPGETDECEPPNQQNRRSET